MTTKSHAKVLAKKHKGEVKALETICAFWDKHKFDPDFLTASLRKLDERQKLFTFYDNVARGK